MAQVTIYLPDEVEKKARKVAKAQGKSVSRWVATQIVSGLSEGWPQGVLDAAGAFPEFPDLASIRHGYGKDVHRESME